MALETIYKTVNDNGEYSCGDIGISKEEWLQLLKNSEAEQYRDALFCFLRMPDNAGTCSAVAQKFGGSPKYYNAKIMNFAKWVQKKLNRFQIIATDGEPTYWCIPMERGYETWQGFKWQLRNELVEALQFYLLKALELTFRSQDPFNGFEEAYKWALLDESEGKNVLEIIKKLPGQIMGVTINLIDNARVNGVLNYLLENKPTDLAKVGEHLIDETKHIDDRIAAFKAEMRSICPSSWKSCANDERTASVILTCKYPERYTFYKDEVYQTICQYFGFESRKPGKKFSHFIEIINRFTAELGEKIQQDMLSQISQFKNKPLNLAVQTLFWCMKDYMKAILDRKTLQKEDNPDTTNEEDMTQQKYKEYIELLKETRNLVLTGAPGTGKTFMARAIAEEMGAVTKFVQFHPSYDYTDFVEGLRPVEKGDDQMGFKRRDGVFKEFCRNACEAPTIEVEISNEEALQLFKKYLKEKGEIEIPSYLSANSVSRTVFLSENNTVSVRVETAFSTSDERILKYMRSRNREEVLGNDTYTYSIGEHILRKFKHKSKRRPFVFIIDEINRGEASKIFGELFFAIDPGYRGKTDFLVQTQYQNLVPHDDVFAEGFYVPENVYILATMNDIDRSVESMDFAMRRRFTWHEITPNDTESMLDELKCADEAKATMHRLNSAIAETDGLGAAYMIGPAYFLKLKDNGGDFDKLWKMNIEPLLKEYLRGFRKTEEILDKFSKAYFDKEQEATTGHPALDE